MSTKSIFLLIAVFVFNFYIILKFELNTNEAGLRTVYETNGVAVADYDLDGDFDIYFVGIRPYNPADVRTWNRLFSNNGDGTYSDVTAASGISVTDNKIVHDNEFGGAKLGASWGDYNNDGYPDLFVTNLNKNQLFLNNGDQTFTDVTIQSGITNRDSIISTSSLWFDYDRDGDLDLYVSNFMHLEHYRDFSTVIGFNNWMYENSGDGTFINVTESSGLIDSARTWMSIALDVNNDGHPDLYLANDFGVNELFINNGDKTFTQLASEYGVNDQYHGMGLAVADLDNNGFFDIYVTNITEDNWGFNETNPLFMNTGQDSFINIAQQANVALGGWGWGTEFFDMDNDGDDDLFVATGLFDNYFSNRLFRNISAEQLLFEDATLSAGLNDFEAARSLAVFDNDNDGDLDILISNVRSYPYLYINQLDQGNWLEIELVGSKTNKNGFGTILEIEFNGSSYRKYHHGAQYFGQNILPVHFGLGTAELVNQLKIYWLSGQIDQFDSIAVNQKIKVTEGGILTKLPENKPENLPESIKLLGNYPNPFNSITRINFIIYKPGDIRFNVYNILGQQVFTSQKTITSSGNNFIDWNPATNGESSLSSGIYLCSIGNAEQQSDFIKIIFLK